MIAMNLVTLKLQLGALLFNKLTSTLYFVRLCIVFFGTNRLPPSGGQLYLLSLPLMTEFPGLIFLSRVIKFEKQRAVTSLSRQRKDDSMAWPMRINKRSTRVLGSNSQRLIFFITYDRPSKLDCLSMASLSSSAFQVLSYRVDSWP